MVLVRSIVLLGLLFIASYTDIRRHEIEDWVVMLGLAFGILLSLSGYSTLTVRDSLVGFFIGGGAYFVLALLTNLGGGDVKLMAMIGYLLGGWGVVFVFIYSALIGGAFGLLFLVLKRESLKTKLKTSVPVAPAMALATAYVLYAGGLLF